MGPAHSCLVSFLTHIKASGSGNKAVGWALLHQLTIKITPTERPIGQSGLSKSPIQSPISGESRLCQSQQLKLSGALCLVNLMHKYITFIL